VIYVERLGREQDGIRSVRTISRWRGCGYLFDLTPKEGRRSIMGFEQPVDQDPLGGE
jgi:hypothetical protein